MKNNFKNLFGILAILVLVVFGSCKKTSYDIGDLNAPSNIVVTTDVIGQDATHPDGDGSGNVIIKVTGDNAMSYRIDFDISNPVELVDVPGGLVNKKFIKLGVNTYTLTVVVAGKGGATTTVTKDVTVRSDFTPTDEIITNLTNNASKTWVVDKDLPAHFGVGPWDVGSIRPEWYAAAPNEKAGCCPCFYSASFVFTKAGSGYTLQSIAPDGVFTKTGALAGGLPGVPASGGEACYSGYTGGTGAFVFAPASSGAPAIGVGSNFGSTQTSMILSGVNTFIGYGAVQKEFEILEITPTTMHLRVRGTETGNAWYIRLKSL